MSISTKQPDVLVVDDDPTTIAGVEAALAMAGYEVAAAPSGREAIRVATTRQPRLMILDVSMPDMDGLSVCRRLRESGETADLPILFLSSSGAVDTRVNGLRAGGNDFIKKPCEPAELLARVSAHLEVATRREALNLRNRELGGENQALRCALEAARDVQSAMLPPPGLAGHGLRFAWRCLQRDRLGGDGIGVLELGEGVYAVYLLDASGHGVPASLLALPAGYFVAALVGGVLGEGRRQGPPSPGAVISDVSRVLERLAPEGTFVTMLVGIADVAAQTFTYSSAGHPGPVLLRACREPEVLDRPAPPAGLGPWIYADRTISFGPGDRLVLYSDGAYEQRNAAGEQFGRARLLESIADRTGVPAEAALDHIVHRVACWRGARVTEDDMSLLAIDYVGGSRRRLEVSVGRAAA